MGFVHDALNYTFNYNLVGNDTEPNPRVTHVKRMSGLKYKAYLYPTPQYIPKYQVH